MIKLNFNLHQQNLNRKSKIMLLLRSNSLDSITTLILFKSIFENINYEFVSYYNIDARLDDKQLENYDFVFLINLCPYYDNRLDNKPKFVILANQETYRHHHSKEKNHYIKTGLATFSLSKHFLESFFKIDMKQFDEMSKILNEFTSYDWKDSKCLRLDWLYKHYDINVFLDRFKDGDVNFTDEELDCIADTKDEIKSVYNATNITQLTEHICIVTISKYLDEMVWLIFKKTNMRFIFVRYPNSKKCSIRTNSNDIDLKDMVKQYNGFGLRKAVSWSFDLESQFEEQLECIIKLIVEEMRK